MSKIRLKQIDNLEISGYIKNVTSGDLTTISGTLSGLTASGLALSGAFGDLYSSFNTISGDISNISGRLNVIESDFATFDIFVSAVSGDLVTTNSSLSTVSGNLDLAEGRLDIIETDIDTLVDDVYTLQTGLVDTDSRLSTVSGRVTTLSGHVVLTSGLVNILSGDVATATGTINSQITGLTGFTGRYVNDYVHLADVSGSGVAGGTFTSGTWVTRNINTEFSDNGGICSITTNQITLSGGTYICDISCPAWGVETHISRLRNISSGISLLSGTSEYTAIMPGSYSVQTRSIIKGRFTLPSSGAILEIQHACKTTAATYGLGVGISPFLSGMVNIYTIAEFRRIAV